MENEPKTSDKPKGGVSVQEIEDFAKKYTTEVFLILAIIIATISSIFDFFVGAGWSVTFAALGTILSLVLPKQIRQFFGKMHAFLHKQQKSGQIVIGIVRLVVALFVPFVLFAFIGLHAGIGFNDLEISGNPPEDKSSS